MKNILISIGILLFGGVVVFVAFFIKDTALQNTLLSLGAGLVSSALTAGLIAIFNHIDYCKRRNYRRRIELHYLSYYMLAIARCITNAHNNKNYAFIIDKLSACNLTDEEQNNCISTVNGFREHIEKELETISNNHDYLSLSGYFTDKEIVFLCRSINYYNKTITIDNLKYVIDNIVAYLKMFNDTL